MPRRKVKELVGVMLCINCVCLGLDTCKTSLICETWLWYGPTLFNLAVAGRQSCQLSIDKLRSCVLVIHLHNVHLKAKSLSTTEKQSPDLTFSQYILTYMSTNMTWINI